MVNLGDVDVPPAWDDGTLDPSPRPLSPLGCLDASPSWWATVGPEREVAVVQLIAGIEVALVALAVAAAVRQLAAPRRAVVRRDDRPQRRDPGRFDQGGCNR